MLLHSKSRLYARVFSSEESLRKSERLTTLETLAGLLNEIKPFNGGSATFDSLELSEEADIHQSKDLSIIREKLNHLDQIAGRILDFEKVGRHLGCSVKFMR